MNKIGRAEEMMAQFIGSKDKFEACFGRLLAAVNGPIDGWVKDELSRGTHPATILSALENMFRSALASVIAETGDEAGDAHNAAMVLRSIHSDLVESIAAARQYKAKR